MREEAKEGSPILVENKQEFITLPDPQEEKKSDLKPSEPNPEQQSIDQVHDEVTRQKTAFEIDVEKIPESVREQLKSIMGVENLDAIKLKTKAEEEEYGDEYYDEEEDAKEGAEEERK